MSGPCNATDGERLVLYLRNIASIIEPEDDGIKLTKGSAEAVRRALNEAADALSVLSEKRVIDCGAPGGCEHPKCDCFTAPGTVSAERVATPTKRAFYERVVEELNLDTRDPFTNLLANAFALVDQRDDLRKRLAEAFAEITRLSAPSSAALTTEAVSVADILAEADHIEKNGKAVALFGGENVDEGRCRELCAMYLREFVQTLRQEQRLAELSARNAGAEKIEEAALWLEGYLGVDQSHELYVAAAEHMRELFARSAKEEKA